MMSHHDNYGRTEQQRRAVAYHEAGYAVAALRQDLPTRKVTIKPEDGADGLHQGYEHPSWRPDPSVPGFKAKARTWYWCFCEAVALLAGGWAQHKAIGRSGPSPSDRQGAEEMCEILSRDDADMSLWLGLVEHTAKGIVEQHWPYVEAVARALLERETLTGKELRKVWRSTSLALMEEEGAQ